MLNKARFFKQIIQSFSRQKPGSKKITKIQNKEKPSNLDKFSTTSNTKENTKQLLEQRLNIDLSAFESKQEKHINKPREHTINYEITEDDFVSQLTIKNPKNNLPVKYDTSIDSINLEIQKTRNSKDLLKVYRYVCPLLYIRDKQKFI